MRDWREVGVTSGVLEGGGCDSSGGACGWGLTTGTQALEACHFLWNLACLERARDVLCIFKKTSFSNWSSPSESLFGSF